MPLAPRARHQRVHRLGRGRMLRVDEDLRAVAEVVSRPRGSSDVAAGVERREGRVHRPPDSACPSRQTQASSTATSDEAWLGALVRQAPTPARAIVGRPRSVLTVGEVVARRRDHVRGTARRRYPRWPPRPGSSPGTARASACDSSSQRKQRRVGPHQGGQMAVPRRSRAAIASQWRLAGDERGARRRRGACGLARPRSGDELGRAHQGSSPSRPCCRASPLGRRRPRAALRRPRPARWLPSASCHARSSVPAAALRGQLRMGRAAISRASPPDTPPRGPAGDGSAGRHPSRRTRPTYLGLRQAALVSSGPADYLVSSQPRAASARRPSSRERRGRDRGTRVWSDAGSVTDSSSGTMPERAGRS